MTLRKRMLALLCIIALTTISLMLCSCGDGYEKDLDVGSPNIQNGRVTVWATNTSNENIYGVSFVIEIIDTSSNKVLDTVKTDRRILAPGVKAQFTASCKYSGGFGIKARVASIDIGRYSND